MKPKLPYSDTKSKKAERTWEDWMGNVLLAWAALTKYYILGDFGIKIFLLIAPEAAKSGED